MTTTKKTSLLALSLAFGLAMHLTGAMAASEPLLDDSYFYGDTTVMADARTFNISLDGLFNNSLLTIGAAIIIGIILFEVALYALDVYYNQTYGFGGSSSSYGQYSQYAYANQRMDEAGAQFAYLGMPKYRDPFTSTYRGLKGPWDFDTILEKISLARDAYDLGTNVLSDMECQKRIICEIYSDETSKGQHVLGELGRRGRHGLDWLDTAAGLSEYISVLPDEILNVFDELQEARSFGLMEDKTRNYENPFKDSCDKLYEQCPVSILQWKSRYNRV